MSIPPAPLSAKGGDAGSAAAAASGATRTPPWDGPAAENIAVIGAGYAGLAAAVELTAAGRPVEVFEASRILGGRARASRIDGFTVDNGQHILVGAYTETLRLMRAVGAVPERLLRRTPLRFEFPGEFVMSAPHLPAPLHTAFALLLAQGLDWREKWAAIRLMQGLQAGKFRIEPDTTVTGWLDRNKTPSRQRRLLWEPLCIAALNTPADRASAQVMANVLRDSLAGRREASDMLLPQVDLTALFPEPAAEFIAARGGAVHPGHRVAALRREADGWHIDDAGPFAQVVLAVAPLPPRQPGAGTGASRGTLRLGTHCHRLLQLPRLGAPAATHARRGRRARAVAVRPRHPVRPRRPDRRRNQRAGPPSGRARRPIWSAASTMRSPAWYRTCRHHWPCKPSPKNAPPSPACRICNDPARVPNCPDFGWPATTWPAITRRRWKARSEAA
jgi:hypothetical protein